VSAGLGVCDWAAGVEGECAASMATEWKSTIVTSVDAAAAIRRTACWVGVMSRSFGWTSVERGQSSAPYPLSRGFEGQEDSEYSRPGRRDVGNRPSSGGGSLSPALRSQSAGLIGRVTSDIQWVTSQI
jgi:hypothetical protein